MFYDILLPKGDNTMKNKKSLLTIGIILFIIGIAIIMIVAATNSREDVPDGIYYGSDITTEEYVEPEIIPEIAFLTEPEWIRGGNCTEQFTFGRDGHFAYWCACGNPVDDYDLYDTFEYKDGVVKVTGMGMSTELNVIYHDENYLCLYLEAEKECRVFVNSDYANSPYVEHDPYGFASDNWVELHILGYDGDNLRVAPYNYDGDAKKEFEEYIIDIPVADGIEFYDVTTIDDKGKVTTEHIKLDSEDVGHIGEYYTSGYAQLDTDGNIKYMVFYGKTVIQ